MNCVHGRPNGWACEHCVGEAIGLDAWNHVEDEAIDPDAGVIDSWQYIHPFPYIFDAGPTWYVICGADGRVFTVAVD